MEGGRGGRVGGGEGEEGRRQDPGQLSVLNVAC